MFHNGSVSLATCFVQSLSLLFMNYFHAKSTWESEICYTIRIAAFKVQCRIIYIGKVIIVPILCEYWVFFSKTFPSSFFVCLGVYWQIGDYAKLYVAWDSIFTLPWATNYIKKNYITPNTWIANSLLRVFIRSNVIYFVVVVLFCFCWFSWKQNKNYTRIARKIATIVMKTNQHECNKNCPRKDVRNYVCVFFGSPVLSSAFYRTKRI